MKHIKVTFSNGDTVETGINGTEEEIINYYTKNQFNLGSGDGKDVMVKGIKVEFLD